MVSLLFKRDRLQLLVVALQIYCSSKFDSFLFFLHIDYCSNDPDYSCCTANPLLNQIALLFTSVTKMSHWQITELTQLWCNTSLCSREPHEQRTSPLQDGFETLNMHPQMATKATKCIRFSSTRKFWNNTCEFTVRCNTYCYTVRCNTCWFTVRCMQLPIDLLFVGCKACIFTVRCMQLPIDLLFVGCKACWFTVRCMQLPIDLLFVGCKACWFTVRCMQWLLIYCLLAAMHVDLLLDACNCL